MRISATSRLGPFSGGKMALIISLPGEKQVHLFVLLAASF